MTIYAIKEATAAKCPYFFSRDSLRVFGQTMRSFSVSKVGPDIWEISSLMRENQYPYRSMGVTRRWFYEDDLYHSLEDACKAREEDAEKGKL